MTVQRRTLSFALAMLLFAFAAVLTLALAPASARGLSPAATPQWGPDILVDSIPTDNHEGFTFATNPVNPNMVIASYKYEDADGPGSGYDLSTDAGRTWSSAHITGTWGTLGYSPDGRASAGFDGRGNAFLSTGATTSNFDDGFYVLTSTNGTTWNTPVAVVTSTITEIRNQPHLLVDRRATGPNAGSAYLFYRWYAGNNMGIWLKYSRDTGATWSGQVAVSDPANNEAAGPSVASASDGTLYAAFQQRDNGCACSPPRLFLDRSTDGGVTWGTDRLVTGETITAVGAFDKEGHDLVLRGGPGTVPDEAMEVKTYPFIAVSPTNTSTVYMVWPDGRWDTTFTIFGHDGKHGDIAFSKTTDAGQTWTAPVRLNDDALANGIDQFMPAIATKADGTIGVTWYDRRVDPSAYDYDVFYTQSTDGGQTWSPNERVSDVSSDPMIGANAKGVGDLGEFVSLVYGPDYVLPAWLDTRNDRQDFYSDRGSFATITPTPTATITPCPLGFTDVHPADYFYNAVRYLYCEGAISGYSDGTFRPYNDTTRGQLSKIVVLAEGFPIDTTGGPHFTDVPTTNPFYAFIETAYNRGLISGYSDGTFRWGNNVTRGQLSKIVVIAEGWTIDTTGGPHFSDVPATDPFYNFIETAYNHGIISGYSDGTFRPNNNATRGQISKIVYNAVTAP